MEAGHTNELDGPRELEWIARPNESARGGLSASLSPVCAQRTGANLGAPARPLIALQRVAYRANVCVIASVESPKQKGKDRYFGRDSMFGSSALPRKVETIILLALTDESDQNRVRHCLLLPRFSRPVDMYFHWIEAGIHTNHKAARQRERRRQCDEQNYSRRAPRL